MKGEEMGRRIRPRYRVGLAALLAMGAMALFTSGASAIVAGAGYTTTGGTDNCVHGTAINCNQYPSKLDVFVSGGPTAGGITTAGDYFFAIIEPGSQNAFLSGGTGDLSLCGNDPVSERTFTVGFNGSGDPIIASYAGTTHDTTTNTNGKFVIDAGDPANLYCDTSNGGGVYILAICSVGATSDSQCKFDAFKAPNTNCEVDCTPNPFGVVSGLKYYDSNLNGKFDSGEDPIPDWPIDWSDGTSGTEITDSNGEFSVSLTADTYTFTEQQATNSPWIQTGNTVNQFTDTAPNATTRTGFVYSVVVADGGVTTGLNFGNVCKIAIGGRTMGFWSNKNGLALVTQADFADLTALHLKDGTGPSGNDVDFTGTLAANKTKLKNYLTSVGGISANKVKATSMAWMLSGQLAALRLSVTHGFTDGSAVVFGDGRSVNQIIADADALLAADGYTPSGDPNRAAQEAIKNLINSINNQLTFTVPSLDDCLADFPPTFAP
jgi:hypothetical protein